MLKFVQMIFRLGLVLLALSVISYILLPADAPEKAISIFVLILNLAITIAAAVAVSMISRKE